MRLISSLVIGAIIFNVVPALIQDCVVSRWGKWSECSAKCNEGFAVRKRTIIEQPSQNIFSKPCPPLFENQKCGTLNNGCQHFCENTTGSCHCKTGFTLGNDQKTCTDKNECYENDGLGPCDQNCTNLKPGYQCSCFRGYLLKDKHQCIDDSAQRCSKFQTRSKENGECICNNGLEGPKCDRNLTRCNQNTCSLEKVCTTLNFVNQNKCFGKFYLVPVLLHLPFTTYSTKNFRYKYKVEEYMTEVIEGSSGKKSLHNLNYDRKRKRRSNVIDVVYVESFDPIKIKAAFTYITFLVFDVKKNFKPYSKQEICSKLVDSDVACISKVDCYILRSVGIRCPDIFELNTNQGKATENETKAGHKKTKPWIYILIFAILFLVFIALILFFYKKKKRSYGGKCENFAEYSDQSNGEQLIMGSGSQPNGINTQRGTSQNDFDQNVFSPSCNDKTPEPLYESIPNIADENNYVDMNMESSKYDVPKNNTGNKEIDLCVDISENEPRYIYYPTCKK